MLTGVLTALGGLGLFLLGMATMTDGLKALPRDRLRAMLARGTRSPTSGAISGALSTAIVQSSSVTTITAIGFVGAGLLTFPEALGIIFGANIGTTITGWLVALFGFKLNVGQIMLPLVLFGTLLRMFSNGRLSAAGMAIAGFGLIFVGIDFLQDGMAAFSNVVTPNSFPSDTIVGRLLLVLIGVAITVVTQSSSAGVAMAMTAIHAGNISLAQGLAMVIGMDIGTTIKAMLATIGGSVQARRTGLAHVIYNLLTGCGAFLLLSPYMWALGRFAPGFEQSDPEMALVLFHSTFNLLGVIAILPFTGPFANLIIRLAPERGNPLTQRLDERLKQTPELAVAAVEATVNDLVTHIFTRLAAQLREQEPDDDIDVADLRDAVKQTQQYLRLFFVAPTDQELHRRLAASIHVLDHLRRLMIRMQETDRLQIVLDIEQLRPQVQQLADTAATVAADPTVLDDSTAQRYRDEYHQLKDLEMPYRQEYIAQAVQGNFDAETVITRTDALRGLRRIGYHVWRIVMHLER